ncbi:MAG: hypothetical protein AB7H92_15170, partial [Microbacteriaceae bacterium]
MSSPRTPSFRIRLRLRRARRRLRALLVEARLLGARATAAVFLGASALIGVDAFGALLALWPLYPTMVPILLVCAALVFAALR